MTSTNPESLFALQELSLFKYNESAPSLDIPAGEVCVLFGPESAGIDRFFEVLVGLSSSCQGDILFQGKSISNWRPRKLQRQIAWIMNKPYFFRATIREELTFLRKRFLGGNKEQDKAADLLDKLAPWVVEELGRAPSSLSDFEQSIVDICRRILSGASVLILDDWFHWLEKGQAQRELAISFLDHLLEYAGKNGITILIHTRDPRLIKRAGGFSIFFWDGHIEAYGRLDAMIANNSSHALRRYLREFSASNHA